MKHPGDAQFELEYLRQWINYFKKNSQDLLSHFYDDSERKEYQELMTLYKDFPPSFTLPIVSC